MLVLTQKVGDTISIGDDITITITKSSNSQVKIGIDAPKSVLIQRENLGDMLDLSLTPNSSLFTQKKK